MLRGISIVSKEITAFRFYLFFGRSHLLQKCIQFKKIITLENISDNNTTKGVTEKICRGENPSLQYYEFTFQTC